MFPDVLHVENDREQRGKVFSLLLERAGGMTRCNMEVTADMEQWDIVSGASRFAKPPRTMKPRVKARSSRMQPRVFMGKPRRKKPQGAVASLRGLRYNPLRSF